MCVSRGGAGGERVLVQGVLSRRIVSGGGLAYVRVRATRLLTVAVQRILFNIILTKTNKYCIPCIKSPHTRSSHPLQLLWIDVLYVTNSSRRTKNVGVS